MMTTAHSWLRENSTLMYFLAAQMFALITGGGGGGGPLLHGSTGEPG